MQQAQAPTTDACIAAFPAKVQALLQQVRATIQKTAPEAGPQQVSLPKKAMQSFSWKARLKSFIYAGAGITAFISSEHNARIHLAATVITIATGFILHISPKEWIAIAGCITLVWVTEMINTCIEKIMNHLSPGYSEAVRDIKDIAAGAVLIATLFAVITGCIIFIPKL